MKFENHLNFNYRRDISRSGSPLFSVRVSALSRSSVPEFSGLAVSSSTCVRESFSRRRAETEWGHKWVSNHNFLLDRLYVLRGNAVQDFLSAVVPLPRPPPKQR